MRDEESVARYWLMLHDGAACVSWAQLFQYLLESCRMFGEQDHLAARAGGMEAAGGAHVTKERAARLTAYLNMLAKMVRRTHRVHGGAVKTGCVGQVSGLLALKHERSNSKV